MASVEQSGSKSVAGVSEVLLAADEMVARSNLLIDGDDFESAVEVMSDCLTKLSEAAQSSGSQTPFLAPYYKTYGEALLRLSQTRGDILSEPFGEKPEADAADVEQTHGGADLKSSATAESDAAMDGGSSALPKDSVVDSTDATKEADELKDATDEHKAVADEHKAVADEKAEVKAETETEESGAEEYAEEGDSDDKALAFECLETARVMTENRIKDLSQVGAGDVDEAAVDDDVVSNDPTLLSLLAEIHALLGEALLDSSSIGEALLEFEKAIEFRKALGTGSNPRQLGFLHYMACIAAEAGSELEKYGDHLNAAFEEVCQRLVHVLNANCGTHLSADTNAESIVAACKQALEDFAAGRLSAFVHTSAMSVSSSSASSSSSSAATDGSSAMEAKKTADGSEPEFVKEIRDLCVSLEQLIEKATSEEEGDDEAANAQVLEQLKAALSEGGLQALMETKFEGIEEDTLDAAAIGQKTMTVGFGTADAKENKSPVKQLGTFGKAAGSRKRSKAEAFDSEDEVSTGVKRVKLNDEAVASGDM